MSSEQISFTQILKFSSSILLLEELISAYCSPLTFIKIMSKNFDELVAVMARLRAPGGCPWDREQTYESLAPYLLEEAFESFDAIFEATEGKP